MSGGATRQVLVTFPGKMGDLLYALPTVIALRRKLGCDVDLLTSSYCRPIVSLLRAQPYLREVLVDEAYVSNSEGFGLQPWKMADLPGYDRVFHLGYRLELLGGKAYELHLKQIPAIILQKVYGIRVRPEMNAPFLDVGAGAVNEEQPFYVFGGYGRSLLLDMSPEYGQRMERLWRDLIPRLPLRGVVLTGESDRALYEGYGLEVRCPASFLESARLLKQAAFFVGAQTSAMSLAEGVGIPIAYLHWMKRVGRRGWNTVRFGVLDNPEAVAQRIERRFIRQTGWLRWLGRGPQGEV